MTTSAAATSSKCHSCATFSARYDWLLKELTLTKERTNKILLEKAGKKSYEFDNNPTTNNNSGFSLASVIAITIGAFAAGAGTVVALHAKTSHS